MERVMMKGNEALAEGAIRAGCRFFFGYPITPRMKSRNTWPDGCRKWAVFFCKRRVK